MLKEYNQTNHTNLSYQISNNKRKTVKSAKTHSCHYIIFSLEILSHFPAEVFLYTGI